MNLQLHLLSRITLVALLCLLAVASYVLYQSHRQAAQATQQMAEALGKQLESQLRLASSGLGQANPFPDFEWWKQSGNHPGVCVLYAAKNKATARSLCNGAQPAVAAWPIVFERVYRRIFNPGWPVMRAISLDGRVYGTLTVTPSAGLEIAEAWNRSVSLLALSGVTVFAVCLLVYLSVNRALRSAKTIVNGLEKLQAGQLHFRLPVFELDEWRRIAAAINQLAASQQQLLEERQKLAVKLINLQEEERRYLARELHDEFGGCLAAINAVVTVVKQTAAEQCPSLVDEAERIGRIVAYMLEGIRGLLGRLRPAEFDELGLAACLNSLVAGWNGSGAGKTRYQLEIAGNCALLSETQAVALFRIAQEGLTNAAKHAAASQVSIALNIDPGAATLTIQDDGIATHLPFADTTGIGLLGIRERLTALHGQLRLAIAEPHGLLLEAQLPIDRQRPLVSAAALSPSLRKKGLFPAWLRHCPAISTKPQP